MRWMAVLLAVFAGLYLHERVRADRVVKLQRACASRLNEDWQNWPSPPKPWSDVVRRQDA